MLTEASKEFLATARAICPEYDPMLPFGNYGGQCRFDWLRKWQGVRCDVPFIPKTICQCGDPASKDETVVSLSPRQKASWMPISKCKKCGRRYTSHQVDHCICGEKDFDKSFMNTDPRAREKLQNAKIKVEIANKEFSSHKPSKAALQAWIDHEYGDKWRKEL
jgi:hypothetical protein